MSYPFEKYRFYNSNKEVIAVSTYAGKTVKGIAKLDPRDTFDVEQGKKLAAARCNEKIARKRAKRAASKVKEAQAQLAQARNYYERMANYYNDSMNEVVVAQKELSNITNQM